MANLMVGTEEVLKVMVGTEEVTSLFVGSEDASPSGGEPTVDYSTMPFTIEALEDGNFTINSAGIDYSTDGGDNWDTTTGATTLSVYSGDTIQFKHIQQGTTSAVKYMLSGNTDITFNAYGNIMSLAYGDNFVGQTDLSQAADFCVGLMEESSVVDASNLELPATSLKIGAYRLMFSNCSGLVYSPKVIPATAQNGCASMFFACTSLTTAPRLPATTLVKGCYSSMFHSCSGLTEAPELPATTLAESCYKNMFYGCKSLTEAPELPATTLDKDCYNSMFRACYNLSYIKCLATDISATRCLSDWLFGVAARGTFVKDANNTSWPSGSAGIPNNWTVVDA